MLSLIHIFMAKKEETISLIDTFSEFKELKNIDRTTMVSVLAVSYTHLSKSAFYSAFSKVAGVSPLSYPSRERRKRELQVINELRY